MELATLQQQAESIVHEVIEKAGLTAGKLLVIGCSTSEVLGNHIGKGGSEEVAEMLFQVLAKAQEAYGIALAFQCCEHLNRALVVERTTMEKYGLDEVSVVPAPRAGGAMGSYAYHHFADPAVVEHIKADAGIDIGDTFIGMHLKHVAVPIRPTVKQIGDAHVTAATTRPKLIGGARAVYDRLDAAPHGNLSC